MYLRVYHHRLGKRKIINIIMSAFFPNTLAIFSKHIFQSLLDKFRLISSSAFFKNDAKTECSREFSFKSIFSEIQQEDILESRFSIQFFL